MMMGMILILTLWVLANTLYSVGKTIWRTWIKVLSVWTENCFLLKNFVLSWKELGVKYSLKKMMPINKWQFLKKMDLF